MRTISKSISISALIIVSSALGLHSTHNVAGTVNPKIIGGSRANDNDFPWITALVYKSDTFVFCGASLISERWLLTAAHCVYNKSTTDIEALINQQQLSNTNNHGERIAIQQIVVHPDFKRITLKNDIALVKLATPSSFKPLTTLDDYSADDTAGESAIALGWGNTSQSHPAFPDDLQQVTLPLISNQKCKDHIGGIEDTMLCAGFDEGGKDTCEGDSGGPLVTYDKQAQSFRQVGITSFGEAECASIGKYGVYTRVKLFKSFISQIVCSPEQSLPAPKLTFNVTNNGLITTSWSTSANASGYRLIYAPYPSGEPVSSFEPLQKNQYATTLPKGSAFYVAITAYNNNCRSTFSNIINFTVP